jgi:ADP-ribosyl-[dinitrogen reductase] hydrolase
MRALIKPRLAPLPRHSLGILVQHNRVKKMTTITYSDRAAGAIVGLAVGDAIGTTVEFRPRGSFTPMTDMVGGGPFNLQPGQWTDDTSMALCIAESLLACGGIDQRDQMERYVRWWKEGHNSSTGRCFDIGNATSSALQRFLLGGNAVAGSKSPGSAGNGCLMRLAPVPIRYGKSGHAELALACQKSSETTHGAEECVDATLLFGRILAATLAGQTKERILTGQEPRSFDGKIRKIAASGYATKTRDQIRGSGYVVDALEAALWCFHTTDTFADAVLTAANLGDDADTTAAITGQIAGAFYGVDGIPAKWRTLLHDGARIQKLARDLAAATAPE